MPRTIVPARMPPGTVPETQGYTYPNGQTFYVGAALVSNGAGQVIEGTSPIITAILVGFAAQPANSQPGFNAANTPTHVTFQFQGVSVWKANKTTVFSSRLVNATAAPIVPVVANIFVNYGLKSYANAAAQNEWVVDSSITGGNASVTVIGIDTNLNIVLFRVLNAVIAPS